MLELRSAQTTDDAMDMAIVRIKNQVALNYWLLFPDEHNSVDK